MSRATKKELQTFHSLRSGDLIKRYYFEGKYHPSEAEILFDGEKDYPNYQRNKLNYDVFLLVDNVHHNIKSNAWNVILLECAREIVTEGVEEYKKNKHKRHKFGIEDFKASIARVARCELIKGKK